jgi:hypothetical protein
MGIIMGAVIVGVCVFRNFVLTHAKLNILFVIVKVIAIICIFVGLIQTDIQHGKALGNL